MPLHLTSPWTPQLIWEVQSNCHASLTQSRAQKFSLTLNCFFVQKWKVKAFIGINWNRLSPSLRIHPSLLDDHQRENALKNSVAHNSGMKISLVNVYVNIGTLRVNLWRQQIALKVTKRLSSSFLPFHLLLILLCSMAEKLGTQWQWIRKPNSKEAQL